MGIDMHRQAFFGKFKELVKNSNVILDAAIPPDGISDFRSWLIESLTSPNELKASLLKGFGLPVGESAEGLACLVSSGTPFSRSLINLSARRIFYILRHVSNVNAAVPDFLEDQIAHNVDRTLMILRQYPHYQQPSFRQLLVILRQGGRLPFGETCIDPDILALITAFNDHCDEVRQYDKTIPETESQEVLRYCLDFLNEVLQGKRQPDDDANVSWALYTAYSISAEQTKPLLTDYLEVYLNPQPPKHEIRELSILSEIFIAFRTNSLTLANLSRIASHIFNEKKTSLGPEGLVPEIMRLGNQILRDARSGVCDHLYHATCGVLAFHQLLHTMSLSDIIALAKSGSVDSAEFCPLPGYVCPSPSLRDKIMACSMNIKDYIEGETEKPLGYFICGPSSCGKTHLAKMLLHEFDRKEQAETLMAVSPTAKDLVSLIERANEYKRIGKQCPPFIMIDEIDQPKEEGVFVSLLELLDYGRISIDGITHSLGKSVILFMGGSKYEDSDRLKKHAYTHKEDPIWGKAWDLLTRLGDHIIDISGESFRSEYMRFLIALAIIQNKLKSRVSVDLSALVALSLESSPHPKCTRQIGLSCDENLTVRDGVWTLPGHSSEALITISKDSQGTHLNSRIVNSFKHHLQSLIIEGSLSLVGSSSYKPEDFPHETSELDIVCLLPKLSKTLHRNIMSKFHMVANSIATRYDRPVHIESLVGPVKSTNNDNSMTLHVIVHTYETYRATSPLIKFAWRHVPPLLGTQSLGSVSKVNRITFDDLTKGQLGLDECQFMAQNAVVLAKKWSGTKKFLLRRHRYVVEGYAYLKLLSYCCLRSTCNVCTFLGYEVLRYPELIDILEEVKISKKIIRKIQRVYRMKNSLRELEVCRDSTIKQAQEDTLSVLDYLHSLYAREKDKG